MSVTVCGIVGSSGAGKTLLVQHLIPVLAEEGLAVGYLKHASHGFDMDHEGTDTARVRDAGAVEVVVVGDGAAAQLWYAPSRPGAPQPFLARMSSCDLVLIEGFTSSEHPKIRVTPAGSPPREASAPVILDLERRADDWDPDSVARAADTLLELVGEQPDPLVSVVADGVEVPMHRFASRIVASTLAGLTSELKGVEQPRTLTVTVRLPTVEQDA